MSLLTFGETTTSDSPFELQLIIEPSLNLKVFLFNHSPAKQIYCHDTFWQSCDLTLTDESCHAVDYDDQRTRMMPSSPISRYAFGSLQPGERTELQSGRFERSGNDGYNLVWGHCRFYKIPPGTYLAVVIMDCQRDGWANKMRKWHTEKGIWKGTLRSNTAKIILP